MAIIVSILAAVFVTVVSHQANAASAEDFYKGKTIRVVVGFAAGGGFDSYARILARHMPRHIRQSGADCRQHGGRGQPSCSKLSLQSQRS